MGSLLENNQNFLPLGVPPGTRGKKPPNVPTPKVKPLCKTIKPQGILTLQVKKTRDSSNGTKSTKAKICLNHLCLRNIYSIRYNLVKFIR